MSQVVFYGFLSVFPLILGAYLGSVFHPKEKIIGVISAFGAGAMIAAITLGLMEESFRLGGFDNSIIGFLAGGILFVVGDLILIKIGGRGHRRTYGHLHPEGLEKQNGWAVVLAAVIDGIPESIGLGISLILNPKIGLLLLVSIFFNNLPEAFSSSYDLKRVGKTTAGVMKIWAVVAFVIFIFVILGYTVLGNISASTSSTIQAIAAGGILAMLASTMMPEAYRESGLSASLATIMGFLLIFVLSKAGV